MTSSFNINTDKTLRIGIMCNELSFSAWEAEIIRHLINTNGVSIELLICNADKIEPIQNHYNMDTDRISAARKLFRIARKNYYKSKNYIKRPLWQRYQNFSNKYNPPKCDERISLINEFINTEIIYCRTYKKGKYSQYFTDKDLAEISSNNLDIILRFGFNIIRGKILDIPQYGVWSFHHGDYQKYRGGPPGFWEIYNKDKFSGAILQRLTDKLDDGIVLYESKIKTDNTSYNNNKNNLFWSTTKWPSIVCRNILLDKDLGIFTKTNTSKAPIYTAPNNWQTIKYFSIILRNKFNSIFSKNTQDRELWAIGFTDEPASRLINSLKPININWLQPPAKRFYADPFIIKKNGFSFIFFEDYSYNEEKGRISYIKTQDYKSFSAPVSVIETDFHLSYPFMIEDSGKYYCIPEQHATEEVALYEAKQFPDIWSKKSVLIENFKGIDPTIFYHNKLWWMFIANQSDDDSSKIFLFYSDKLEGSWKKHKKVPLRISPKMTRPAGPIFEYNGRLIRPAQNCKITYGGSILFYEITKLTTEEFSEVFIGELLPDKTSEYPDGLHHIIQDTNMTILDGKRWV